MKAMILAAGRGERLRPVTDTLPKPLVPVMGRPLIEHHVVRLAAAGFRDVAVNVSWLGDLIREQLGDGARHGVRVQYSDEGPVALETGGGIHRMLPLVGDEPFAVINADIYTDFPFERLKTTSLGDALAHLVLIPNPAHHPNGDFTLQDGRVGEGAEDRLTFSGIAVYQPEFFAGCQPGKFPLLPLLRKALGQARLQGERYDGTWDDVGTVQRLNSLRQRLGATMEPAVE